MSTSVTVAGTSYPIPTPGDVDWGTNLTNWIRAVSPLVGTSSIFYNVKDYGAKGDNSVDDRAAIQATIDAASASTYSGIIYFPPGEYNVRSTITLPRNGFPLGKTLVFKGSGIGSTKITDSGYLGTSVPMWKVAATPTLTAVTGLKFSDMTWARTFDGTVWEHTKPTGDPVSERMFSCTFENLYIRGAFASSGTVTKTLLNTEGAIECDWKNVRIDGGLVGFNLKDASHCIVNVFMGIDNSCKNFMVVDGGGSHYMPLIRAESCYNGGTAFLFKNATNGNKIGVLQNEGKQCAVQVDFEYCINTTIDHLSLATPTQAGAIGLKVRASSPSTVSCGNKVFSGLGGSGWSGVSGKLMQFDTYVTEFDVENFHLYGSTAADIDISAFAGRVQVDYFTGSIPGERATKRSTGYTAVVTNPQTTLDAHQFDKYLENSATLTHTSGATITDITGGVCIGQKYYAKMTTANVTFQHSGGGNLRLNGAANWNPPAGSNIVFRFDGTVWDEISRKAGA